MAAEANEALRRALEAGDFKAAEPLVSDFGSALCRQIALAPTAQARASLHSDALNALSRYLYLARAMRSHLLARLQALTAHSLYQAKREEAHTWRVDG